MQTVPLQPLPNQNLQCQLGGQACTISVFQSDYGLFITLAIGATIIVASVPAQNLNRIVRDAYLGFIGDLIFFDTQGTDNPDYTGLGGASARFQLIYLASADLPNGES